MERLNFYTTVWYDSISNEYFVDQDLYQSLSDAKASVEGHQLQPAAYATVTFEVEEDERK